MVDPRKIWSSNQLPTLPSVAVRLLDISKDPETEIKEVVDVIKTDPAISAKILKSANSSFFGLRSEVTSLERAVPLLGTTVVSSLALSFSLVEAAMTSGPMVAHYNAYWLKSVVQGFAAEVLSEYSRDGLDCEFFLAGLLANIGRLAMLKTIPKEYLPVLEQARDQQAALHELESQVLGFNHVEIGAKLAENWSLAPVLIKAIEYHHAPLNEVLETEESAEFALVKAVAAASAVGEYFCSTNRGPALKRLQQFAARLYDLSGTDLEAFLTKVKARVDESGELFSVNADDLGDPSDLMAEANEHLAQLAMREHVASRQATAQQKRTEREKQELEAKHQALQSQAVRDPLTGIYNRSFLDEALQNEIDRCSRCATLVGVIFADIDRFKQLNDTYGHQFGDLVLKQISQAFGKLLRKADVLARFGGEEFVVLVNQPTEMGLALVAERLRQCVEAEEVRFGETRIPVTASFGAAIAMPARLNDDLAQQLVAAADAAMYESKRNGRNRVQMRSLLNENERRLARLVAEHRFSRWLVRRQILDVSSVSKALLGRDPQQPRIGELAQQQHYLDAAESQIELILETQRRTGARFGDAAIQLGLLTEEQVAHLLALQQENPIDLARRIIALGLLEKMRTIKLLKQFLTEKGHESRSMQTTS